MKILYSLFLLLLSSLSAFSQIYKPIEFPEKIDKRYIFDPLKEQEKYSKKLKKSLPKKELEKYTAQCVFTKSEMFADGDVYLSWPTAEEYVNKILDSILPPILASKKIKAYVGRNASINAYCLYDGTMIVNAGLLAEVKNEAALAIIMGHELEHFVKNHLLKHHQKSIESKKSKKNELKEILNVMGFSQSNELEADLYGFAIAKSANYNLEDGMSNFELFIREKEYYEKRNKSSLAQTDSVELTTKAGKFKANTLEKLLSTHPDYKDRKDKLSAYIKGNPQAKKTSFKFKEEQFYTLQEQARKECIALMFNDNNYQECLERTFMYHLFNPNELTYQYYISESIRRICLLDYTLRKKGFLTERLVNEGFKEGQGILHDLKYLIPNSEKYASIKATELINKPATFETYKDAFYYFTQKLLDKNYQESYLSRALFENNKEKINTNISKYLASPKPQHKDYATFYRDNKLTEKILANEKEIVLVPRVDYFSNHGYSTVSGFNTTEFYYKKSETTGKELSYEIATKFNATIDNVKTISIPQAALENFNTKIKNQTIINRTLLARRDENEGYKVVHYYKELEDEDYIASLDIFRLDPETWELFNSNGIKAITSANFTRHQDAVAKQFRSLMLILAVPTVGLTLFFVPFVTVRYKLLTLVSYDSKLGAVYYAYELKRRGITANKARKMYLSMKKDQEEFTKEYNEKF